MHQVTVEKTKARFDELIEAVLRGENVILMRDGENLDFITVDALFKPYPINIVW
jgi:hypothetical protein